jgi:hypothetical protein
VVDRRPPLWAGLRPAATVCSVALEARARLAEAVWFERVEGYDRTGCPVGLLVSGLSVGARQPPAAGATPSRRNALGFEVAATRNTSVNNLR